MASVLGVSVGEAPYSEFSNDLKTTYFRHLPNKVSDIIDQYSVGLFKASLRKLEDLEGGKWVSCVRSPRQLFEIIDLPREGIVLSEETLIFILKELENLPFIINSQLENDLRKMLERNSKIYKLMEKRLMTCDSHNSPKVIDFERFVLTSENILNYELLYQLNMAFVVKHVYHSEQKLSVIYAIREKKKEKDGLESLNQTLDFMCSEGCFNRETAYRLINDEGAFNSLIEEYELSLKNSNIPKIAVFFGRINKLLYPTN